MANIRDVAERAGVSIKTVSRVINADPAVRGETAERVRHAIAALDYVPDPHARAMRGIRSGTLGLVSDMVTTTPYAVEIIRGVQDACAEAGLILLISNTKGRADLTARAVATLLDRKVEAIIFATMFLRSIDLPPVDPTVPVILVNCFTADGRHLALVPDDYGGSYAATRHLISLGHAQIGLVSINPAIVAAERRAAGFRAALRDAGLPVRSDRIQSGQHFAGDGEPFTVAEAMAALLAQHPRPTAILCGTDAIAMRVYAALTAAGLRIPDDVSVVGTDNFALIVEGLSPPLTSVALPYYDMGHLAVQEARAAREPGFTPRQVCVPCPLVLRASIAPPARAAA